jgi:HEAT repeats
MAIKENIPSTIEQLLTSMARTNYWAVQYGPNHPATFKHIHSFHSALSACLASEPENRLLLGVARDKFYYQDKSVGKGNEVIKTMTEQLYVLGVATISFGPQLSAKDLAAFFKFLFQGINKKPNESFDQYLQRVDVTGIQINKYNFKELLSHKTGEVSGIKIDAADREDFLLRSLIFSYARQDDETEQMFIDNIVNYPEMLTAIVERANMHGNVSESAEEGDGAVRKESISPEILKRLLQRLGGTLKGLPEDRKKAIIAFLEVGLEKGNENSQQPEAPLGLFIAKSLTDEFSSDEFLDLLGMILSAEGKTSNRFRNSFQVLAAERNNEESLLTSLSGKIQESQKSKDFYALKTWETVENLLLSRTDDVYIDSDHANFLEYISSDDFKNRDHASKTLEPCLLESLSQDEQHKKEVVIILELLGAEKKEEVFYDLVEEIRKIIPNLISHKDISLLETVLFRLSDLSGNVSGNQGKILQDIIAKMDFGNIIHHYLQNTFPPDTAATVLSIMAKFAPVTTPIILNRLLSEKERSHRRILMKMITSLGAEAVPILAGKLTHSKWYFVRNLCTALGDIGDPRAISGLLKTITHEDWRVRREAIVALGKLRSKDIVLVLGGVLTEDHFFSSQEEESIRLAAASALFQIGGEKAFSYLERGSHSRRVSVKEYCKHLTGVSRGAL